MKEDKNRNNWKIYVVVPAVALLLLLTGFSMVFSQAETVETSSEKGLTEDIRQVSDFVIEITAFEDEIVEGEDQIVNYTVTNEGIITGTQDIVFEVYDAYDLGGEVIYTDVEEDLTLDGGEVHTRGFNWTSEEAGVYSFEVSSEDDAEDRNFDVIVEGAFLGVTIDAYEAEIVEGEDQMVEYTVTNTGDETAMQDILFEVYDAYDLGGEMIYTQTEADVTLDAGQTYSDTFSWTSTSSGEYSFKVSSENDSEYRNFDVMVEGSFFEMTTEAYEAEVVEGEDQIVDYTVNNTGDEPDTQDIVFEVYDAYDLGGESIYIQTEADVTLESGQIYTGTFSWTSIDPGNYSFEVSSENNSEYRNFDVIEDAFFDLTIEAYEAEVVEGEDQVVDYTVENIGEDTSTQDIVFEVYDAYDLGGTIIDTQTEADVNLDAGQTYSDTFPWTGIDPGNYSFEVSSEDDAEYRNFDVMVEGPFFEVTIDAYEAEIVEGEDQVGDYTVENVGDDTDTQDIVFEVYDAYDLGGTVIDIQTEADVDLDAGQTYLGTFIWTSTDSGEYSFEVSSEGDAEDRNFDVMVEGPFFEVMPIDAYEAEIVEGEDQIVDYTVENVGNETMTQDIVFEIYDAYDLGGTVIDTQTEADVNLESGQSHSGTFIWTSTDSGEYSFEVSSEDDAEDRNFDVIVIDRDVKEKTLYLHNETGTVNGNTVTMMNTTMGDEHNIEVEVEETMQLDWYLDPPFVGNFTLNGTISAHIWAKTEDVTGDRNQLTFHMELLEIPAGEDPPTTIVQASSDTYEEIPTVFDEYSVSTELDERYEVGVQSRLQVIIQIEGDGNFPKPVAYGDSEYPSRLEVGTEDYIDVDTFTILDSDYNESYDFRLGADETVIHFNTSITDPFGGYDINRVNLTVEGPEGIVFYREPMIKVSGNDTSYRSNYTYEWDYGGVPEGEYTAIVSAVDNTGYHYRYPDNPGDETYGGHLESAENDFWIGAERHFVHFKTVDALNETMEDAKVSIYSSPGMEEVTFNLTDEEGITNISVTDGEYLIRVYWEEVVVNETMYQVSGDISYGEAIVMNCSVYELAYQVLDSRDNEVGNANLFIRHPNGTLLRRVTDQDGEVKREQTPFGNYTVTTEWLGREVEYTEHYLDSTDYVILEANVYYLEISTVDSHEEPVSEVHVSSRFNDTERLADAKLTDINGETPMRLPGTEQQFGYDLLFQWRGVDVGQSEDEPLESDRDLEFELEIYYIDFSLTDSIGEDLEDATLSIYNVETDTLANTGVTDEEGEVTLRLPRGPHEILVTWRGLEVAEEDHEVIGDASLEIECAVYHVDFTAMDSQEEPLAGSRITVSHQDVGLLNSETADEEGNVSMRLPGASLDVEVDWRGVTVFSETIAIDSNDPILLESGVYYLDFEGVDDLEEPLENARIELYHGGTFLAEILTDNDGLTEDTRLPGTEIEAMVSWRGVRVYEDEIDLNEDSTEYLQVNVYHLTFQVEDDIEEAIPRADLTITHEGNLLLSGRTDEEGIISGRIPGALNTVTGDWHGIRVYEEDLEFDASEDKFLEVEAVHRLIYTVIDSRDEPLENAVLDFHVEGNFIGRRATDAEGFLTIRIPTPHDDAGEVDISGRWRDVLVYEESFTIDSHVEEELRADVYYMDYTVVDDEGVPVENAKVIGRHSELPERRNIITDRLTDDEGYIEFRLPRGEQEFTVNWRGITIYQDEMDITSDVEEEVTSHVYYLTMDVVDDEGVALEDAFVRVTYEDTPRLYHSDYTGEDGSVEVRIPRATWDLEVRWMDKAVYDEHYEVNTTETIEIEPTVYYLNMNVVDDEGVPLERAYVSLDYADTGEFYHTGYTDMDGKLEVRIPGATWYIEIEWKGITVYEEEYEVTTTEDSDMDIYASVYYLSLDVVDDEGEPLEAARVRLNYGDTGAFYNARYTDEEGFSKFRLPNYEWDVKVKWLGISVYEETHDVNATEEIEVET